MVRPRAQVGTATAKGSEPGESIVNALIPSFSPSFHLFLIFARGLCILLLFPKK